jgi:hypothetical protein
MWNAILSLHKANTCLLNDAMGPATLAVARLACAGTLSSNCQLDMCQYDMSVCLHPTKMHTKSVHTNTARAPCTAAVGRKHSDCSKVACMVCMALVHTLLAISCPDLAT